MNGVRRNDQDELEPFNEETTTGAPGFTHREREQFESRVVVPLEISNAMDLEKYLLDPKGAYVLNLTGYFYSEELGYPFYKENVEVSISMSPDE